MKLYKTNKNVPIFGPPCIFYYVATIVW